MPFIPHTEEDVSAMLGAIGAASIEDLFDEIPPALKTGKLRDVPDGLPEMAVARLMQERATQDGFCQASSAPASTNTTSRRRSGRSPRAASSIPPTRRIRPRPRRARCS
jgi:hypothetical protein